eukprot:6429202-Amphidinium_carterae.1
MRWTLKNMRWTLKNMRCLARNVDQCALKEHTDPQDQVPSEPTGGSKLQSACMARQQTTGLKRNMQISWAWHRQTSTIVGQKMIGARTRIQNQALMSQEPTCQKIMAGTCVEERFS